MVTEERLTMLFAEGVTSGVGDHVRRVRRETPEQAVAIVASTASAPGPAIIEAVREWQERTGRVGDAVHDHGDLAVVVMPASDFETFEAAAGIGMPDGVADVLAMPHAVPVVVAGYGRVIVRSMFVRDETNGGTVWNYLDARMEQARQREAE